MQLSLLAAFIPIVNILWCGVSGADNCTLADLFRGFGYSRECVVSSLASIVLSKNFLTTNECSLTEELVSQQKSSTNTLTVVQSLHQEAKSERENITNILTEVNTLLQVVKSEMKTLLQEMKSERENSVSEIKTLLQEIKSEGESSSSVVKALLQEVNSERVNSVSEIKTLLQEVKTEQQNEKKKSPKFEAVINSKLKNCADLRVLMGDEFSAGVQTVHPYGYQNPKQTTVYCDQVTDGGGWTVIQSRSPLPVRENFTRNWNDYVQGFGDLKGEYWLGLDHIHALTNSAQMELRVDLEDAEGQKRFAKYRTFHVGDAASKYVLRIEGYSGDAGDAMTHSDFKDSNLNAMMFSTFDNKNDLSSKINCAKYYHGGWWFNACFIAHLNGLPIVGKVSITGEGIQWNTFRDGSYSLKKANMKIRPVSLGF